MFVPGFRFDATFYERFVQSPLLAQLWLVPNQPHHPEGDFGIDAASGLATRSAQRRTWASVGLFRRELFDGIVPGTRMPLRPLFESALDAGRLGAEAWDGEWTDVGTVERLRSLHHAVQLAAAAASATAPAAP